MFIGATAASHATAAANTNVVITLAARADLRHVLGCVAWSYSGAPTGGRLTVTIGGATVMDLDITAAEPRVLNLPELAGAKNAAVVVTLYAGGAGVVGKLNVYSGARS